MKPITRLFLLAALTATFSSCEDDDDSGREDLVIPSTYDGTNFEASTTVQQELLADLQEQVNIAKAGRMAGTNVSATELQSSYVEGNPSLRDVSTTYYVNEMEGTEGIMSQLALASGNTYSLGDTEGQGGVYGSYLFNEYGLEYEQLLEKGQFGAVLYNHAVQLLSENISSATVHQAVAIFGSNPSFPNTNNPETTADPDGFMATYAARRDNNDGTGLYFQIKNAFIKMQAAIKAGGEFTAERDEAIADIKLTWEKINAATTINYCHQATASLSNADLTESQIASALHALGEGIGFTKGWHSIPSNSKLITDSEIEEILVLFNAPIDADQTAVYTFATDGLNQLPKLQLIMEKLQNIYGFTDQEIESYKQNWVSVQGR